MIRTDVADECRPLLILGIAPRSGTNFVYNLLRAHPELNCVTSPEVPEHFIVRHSGLLLRYAGTLAAFWGQHWRQAPDRDRGELDFASRKAAIASALGKGLLDLFVVPDDERRIVTKTPSVEGLPNAFELFPNGQVIVVMRDGRSVCESAHASAGDPYELTMQRWARAARLVRETMATVSADRLLVVRYEDLVGESESTLRSLFEFAGVDPVEYDYGTAERLPILGSSQFYGDNDRQWQRVERTEDFDSTERWSSWSHDLLERFDHVAGAESAAFGYDTGVTHRQSDARHALRSVRWAVRSRLKNAMSQSQRMLYRLDVFGRGTRPFDID